MQLLSEVIQQHLKPGHITRDQLVAHAFLLLVAGNATVAGVCAWYGSCPQQRHLAGARLAG